MRRATASTDAALLAAIYAAPADDGPRLVYADALMERGDPRGEVIALQCGNRDHARADKLLARHRAKWLGPLAPAIDATRALAFERGFPALATVADTAPPALDQHPAWATLRRVELGRLARKRTALVAHLARLGVAMSKPRKLASPRQVLADLAYVAGKGENRWWHAARAFGNLGAGVDKRLVERAMRVHLPSTAIGACNDLLEEYVPIAWRVLARVKTAEATFLRGWHGHDDTTRLREACRWLFAFRRVDGKPGNRSVLPELARDGAAVLAAYAAVRAHGLAAQRLLAVPAHVGDAEAVALVQPVIARALAAGGEDVDKLEDWFVPFVRGPGMTAIAATIAAAKRTRGTQSPLLALLARFGATGDRLELDFTVQATQVRYGTIRKATASIDLYSHRVPSATATFTWNLMNFQWSRWQDGKLVANECKVGGPRGVDDIPRWLAASAKQRKVTWDPTTVRLHGSLRGKARAAAVAWLLGRQP